MNILSLEVFFLEYMFVFIATVMGNVVSHYIIKWADGLYRLMR